MDDREELKQLHVRLSREVYTKLKVKCVYGETSIQEYVAKLLTEKLKDSSTEAGVAYDGHNTTLVNCLQKFGMDITNA